MKIQCRDFGAASVLSLSGRMAGAADHRSLRDEVDALLAAGRLDIVVSMARLSWIDSTGLGALVAAFDAVRRRGGRLLLCAVNERVDHVVGGSGMYSLFTVHRSEEEALAALAAGGESGPGVGL